MYGGTSQPQLEGNQMSEGGFLPGLPSGLWVPKVGWSKSPTAPVWAHTGCLATQSLLYSVSRVCIFSAALLLHARSVQDRASHGLNKGLPIEFIC